MAKHDNIRLPLRTFSIHVVRTSIEDNGRTKNVCKGRMSKDVLVKK